MESLIYPGKLNTKSGQLKSLILFLVIIDTVFQDKSGSLVKTMLQ